MDCAKPNIVVFGETGAGKSSLVNLLCGKERASVNDGAVGCTFKFEEFQNEHYNIVDTVGLSEGSKGTMTQREAVSNLVKLLKSLASGVCLLIFVIEKGRIKKTLEENYKLFVKIICNSEVPVLLLVNKCEMEMQRGGWWIENKKHFDTYGLKFAKVVSGCCMDPDNVPPTLKDHVAKMNQDTLREVQEGIFTTMRNPPWVYTAGWMSSFMKAIAFLVEAGEIMLRAFTFGAYQPRASQKVRDQLSRSEIKMRLVHFFMEQGHDIDTSREMANGIVDSM